MFNVKFRRSRSADKGQNARSRAEPVFGATMLLISIDSRMHCTSSICYLGGIDATFAG